MRGVLSDREKTNCESRAYNTVVVADRVFVIIGMIYAPAAFTTVAPETRTYATTAATPRYHRPV